MSELMFFSPSGHDICSTFVGHFVGISLFWAVQRFARYSTIVGKLVQAFKDFRHYFLNRCHPLRKKHYVLEKNHKRLILAKKAFCLGQSFQQALLSSEFWDSRSLSELRNQILR